MVNVFKSWVTVKCSKCGYLFDFHFRSPKLQETVYCHNCKTAIRLADDSSLEYNAARRINRSLRYLDLLFKMPH